LSNEIKIIIIDTLYILTTSQLIALSCISPNIIESYKNTITPTESTSIDLKRIFHIKKPYWNTFKNQKL